MATAPDRVRGRSAFVSALALAGGVAVVVGSILPWFEMSAGPFGEQARGIDGWEGKASLIAGLVMVVASVRALSGSAEGFARLPLRAGAGGLVASVVGAYTALTARQRVLDVAGIIGTQVEGALDSGLFELSMGTGVWLVIVGGVQGVLLSVVALGMRARASTSAGAGLRGWSRPGADVGDVPGGRSAPALPPPPGGGSEREDPHER